METVPFTKFHTGKLGEITVFYAVMFQGIKFLHKRIVREMEHVMSGGIEQSSSKDSF